MEHGHVAQVRDTRHWVLWVLWSLEIAGPCLTARLALARYPATVDRLHGDGIPPSRRRVGRRGQDLARA